jgi:hypothetical protein
MISSSIHLLRAHDDTDEVPRRYDEALREHELPTCLREALKNARASRTDSSVRCISYHSEENGRAIARVEPPAEFFDDVASGGSSGLKPKDLLVLSVAVTETTFARVRTVTHVLVTHLTAHAVGEERLRCVGGSTRR